MTVKNLRAYVKIIRKGQAAAESPSYVPVIFGNFVPRFP
jgi:hypothetical protein